MVLVLVCASAALLWLKRADLLARWPGVDSQEAGYRPDLADLADRPDLADLAREGSPDTPMHRSHLPPDVPLAPAGEHVDITLAGEPAAWYAAPGHHGNDQAYREIVAEVVAELGAGEVRHDPALSRAAREVAYQIAVLGFAPPEAALTFILQSHGAPDTSASQFFTHTTSEDEAVVRDAVRRAIAGAPGGGGPLRIGVGEVSTPGQAYTRHVSVLATRRDYEIEPAPRQVERDRLWTLEGALPPGYRDLRASVLYADGRIGEAEIEARGERFVVRAPAGAIAGTMHVDVSGTDHRGPGKIMQLAVEVGREPPRQLRVHVPEREPAFATIEQAEEYALALLNRDRARAGLPALVPDAALAAVARAHSQDMRDHGFFAHASPSTGLAGDRLARAGYRAMTHAENLARNDSLGEAEASLMASVGHRQNILSPRFTHAGVGLARRQQGERTEWFVTQLFARPVTALDATEARAILLERINAARGARSAAPVRLDPRISTIAQGHAREVAGGALEGVAQRVIDDLAAINASMSVAVNVIYDFAAFEPPEAALGRDVRSVGIGVEQSPDDAQGRTGVIIVAVKR
jgi:uncharacterized protein YkwD